MNIIIKNIIMRESIYFGIEIVDILRKKISELREKYVNSTIKIINTKNHNISVDLSCMNENEFKQIKSEVNKLIFKLTEDYKSRQERKKLEKKRRQRKQLFKATKNIENNIKNSTDNKLVINDEEKDALFLQMYKKNPYYGLELNKSA